MTCWDLRRATLGPGRTGWTGLWFRMPEQNDVLTKRLPDRPVSGLAVPPAGGGHPSRALLPPVARTARDNQISPQRPSVLPPDKALPAFPTAPASLSPGTMTSGLNSCISRLPPPGSGSMSPAGSSPSAQQPRDLSKTHIPPGLPEASCSPLHSESRPNSSLWLPRFLRSSPCCLPRPLF